MTPPRNGTQSLFTLARRIGRASALPILLLLTSCLEVAAPPARDALAVRDVKAPEGVGLETACVPSGVELCFDARDNNCNGVIDEGCGLHTGILQFTIAWESADTDVDLEVFDAQGNEVRGNEPTSGGLLKDRNCPGPNGECQGQNVENVYLAEGDPKRGRYRVVVRLKELKGGTPPVRVRLSARVGQRAFGMTVELAPGPSTEAKTFEFSL